MNKDSKLLIQFIIKSIEYHAAQHVYRGRKMGSSLNIKNQTKLDYTYLVECPENTSLETYLGETAKQPFISISSFISIS